MRSGTQPGYHARQKAAGLGAALAHGTRGGFLRCLGLFSVTAYKPERIRKAPMRSGAQPGSSCQAKKNPPALPGDRFCDRGRRGSKELSAVDLQLEGEIQIFRRTFGEHHAGEEDLKVVHNGTDAGVDGEDQRNGAGAAVEDQ